MDLTRISDNCASTQEFAHDLAKVLQLVEVNATCDDNTEVVPLLVCKSTEDLLQVYEDMKQNGCQPIVLDHVEFKSGKLFLGMLCAPYAVVPANDGNLDLGHIDNPNLCLKVIDARDKQFMVSLQSERNTMDNKYSRLAYQIREIHLAKCLKSLH